MAVINVSGAHENLSEAIETAKTEPVFVERGSHAVAVMLSPERYEELISAFGESEDVASFDAAMGEEGPSLPWEQVASDLG